MSGSQSDHRFSNLFLLAIKSKNLGASWGRGFFPQGRALNNIVCPKPR